MKETEPSNQCVRWFYCVLFSCYLHPFHLFIFCSVSQTHNILCTLCKYKRLNRNAFRISHRISESVIILYSIWIRTDLFVHHIFIHIFVSCRKIHTHSHILGGKKEPTEAYFTGSIGKKKSPFIPNVRYECWKLNYRMPKKVATAQTHTSKYLHFLFFTSIFRFVCAFHIYLIICIITMLQYLFTSLSGRESDWVLVQWFVCTELDIHRDRCIVTTLG